MIYINGKYNNKQIIPRDKNFADAMYGFLELGAEIQLFDNLNTVYNDFTINDTIVDYIDPVNYIMRKFNKDFIDYINYPEELNEFYGRKIWKDNINHFSSDENLWSKGYFVKPIKEKAFTGRVVKEIKDLIGCGNYSENYEILVSEPVIFIQEWRGFIYYDELFDLRPYVYYDSGEPDREILNKIMSKWITIKDRPNACSIDIGLTSEGKTLIVEVNDCISLGNYGLPIIDYAKMINARQSQILNRKDEYYFGHIRQF